MSIDREIDNLIDDIREDRTHGASELARQAAQVIKTAVGSSRANTVKEFLQEQQDIGQRLMSARPAMASVFNIVSRILDIIIYLKAAWFGWIDLGKRGNTPYIPDLAALITCGATVPKAHLAEADRGVGE